MFPFFFCCCCWNITWKRYIRVDKHTSVTKELRRSNDSDWVTHDPAPHAIGWNPSVVSIRNQSAGCRVFPFCCFYLDFLYCFAADWLLTNNKCRWPAINPPGVAQIYSIIYWIVSAERSSFVVLVIDWSFTRLSFCRPYVFIHVARFVCVCVLARYRVGITANCPRSPSRTL